MIVNDEFLIHTAFFWVITV